MRVAVVLSTYNSPERLELVLCGFESRDGLGDSVTHRATLEDIVTSCMHAGCATV